MTIIFQVLENIFKPNSLEPFRAHLCIWVGSLVKHTKPSPYKPKTLQDPHFLFSSFPHLPQNPKAAPSLLHFSVKSHQITYILFLFSFPFHPSHFSYLLHARRKLVGEDELTREVSNEVQARQVQIHVLEVGNARNL